MNDIFELVRGSENVFHDLGRANAGFEQVRVVLTAEIIRNAKLACFTLDRMIAILGKLDGDVEISLTFRLRLHTM
nr:hypothetical protein [Desulfobacula sp.]